MQESTDEDLMLKVTKGDLDKLKILFDRHHVYVFNFLFKMSRDKMLSEDMTQDVFYKLLKYRNTYKGGSFVSWMFTIARNGLKSHYSRNKENYPVLSAMEYKLGGVEAEISDDFHHLQIALDKLEASDRELLILNRLQEIKYAELAEIFGSTQGAVKTKVSRALKKLKIIYFQNI